MAPVNMILPSCHAVGWGPTILSSRIDVLAFWWVLVWFGVVSVRFHGDRVTPDSNPFCFVLWVSMRIPWGSLDW
jgi:hypothetical protein